MKIGVQTRAWNEGFYERNVNSGNSTGEELSPKNSQLVRCKAPRTSRFRPRPPLDYLEVSSLHLNTVSGPVIHPIRPTQSIHLYTVTNLSPFEVSVSLLPPAWPADNLIKRTAVSQLILSPRTPSLGPTSSRSISRPTTSRFSLVMSRLRGGGSTLESSSSTFSPDNRD